MWSVERLKAVIADRGESEPDGAVCTTLLLHERSRGRTEEDYPRDKAREELDAHLANLSFPLPRARAGEYPGLTQLREYAEQRGLAKAAEKAKAPEAAPEEPRQNTAQRMTAPSVPVPERERG